jgi:hypothetical protein
MPSRNLYDLIRDGKYIVNHMSPAQFRFLKNIDKESTVHPIHGPCWMWKPGPVNQNVPYGQFRVGKKGIMRPHRYSWEVYRGPLPDDTHVLHKCDTPLCVNPAHLFLGTNDDNVKDKVEKGRQARGEQMPIHKFTEDQIRQIRARYRRGCSVNGQTAIAKDFGVTPSAIGSIVNNRSWKHVI